MSRLIALFAYALVALALASCASPQSKLLGKWSTDMGLGFIEFQRGGRYTWNMAGAVQQGTWRVEKKELRLSMDSMSFDAPGGKGKGSSSGLPNMDELMKNMPKVEVIYGYTLKGKDLTIQLSDMSFTFHKQ
jgi:hypothetical protein